MTLDPSLAGESFCYLTTTGLRSGKPHEIEIWFALDGATLYLLSGGGEGSDWVKNFKTKSEAAVRIGEASYHGHARLVDGGDEDAQARRLLLEKYGPTYAGDLSNWGRTAVPVAIDIA